MPTITVNKADLFKALGKDFSTQEFDDLCFEFGIELDEDTTDDDRPIVNGVQVPPELKIDIPANRYDMLCFEGIAMNLKVFMEQMTLPEFKVVRPEGGKVETITVKEDTARIRPYVVGAVLRNIKFDQKRYDSFIALQDKIHQNLARQRTLVSIGTHDLDTIKGPFSYEALPPEQIKFAPLNQEKEMDGNEIMAFYEKDKHLGRYLHIIRDSPVYPVILDANRVVCSLPPIINGNHSKITLNTTNVLIEITATDKTKVEIALNILCAMFSVYCGEQNTVEPLHVISPHDTERDVPDLSPQSFNAEVDYINSVTGLDLTPKQQCDLLKRMGHSAQPSAQNPQKQLAVRVPVTRPDVLHQADIMEDVAVAYGFNNLPRFYPNKTAAVGAPLPINKLGDIVRLEAAMSGWSEVMPLILCSHDENFAWLNRPDDGTTAVRLQNPKSAEYQVVRTSLLPGLLKTIRENKHRPVPMRVFEVSDVAFKAPQLERKARNERHFAAAWYGKTSGFEVVHGLLDRVMAMLKTDMATPEEGARNDKLAAGAKYWIEEIDDPTFFQGHAASVNLKLDGKVHKIGSFGVLHPTVLKNYELPFPVSALELNLEVFL